MASAVKTLLHRDRFSVLMVAQELDDEQVLMLPTALARAGWRLRSAPTHVYRQVFKGEHGLKMLPYSALVFQDRTTQILYRAPFPTASAGEISAVFDKLNVFVQCTADTPYKICDRTTHVVVESYGKVGVRRLKPQQGGEVFARVNPPKAAAESIESLLAADMKRFVKERVFIETHSPELLFNSSSRCDDLGEMQRQGVDASEVIVCHNATGGFFFGEDAKVLIGKYASPRMMNELGYAVFLMAQTPNQIVGLDSRVLYTKEYAEEDDEGKGPPPLERLVHANGRFECCEYTGPTIGAALRRNDIHYAALHGIFVRCMSDIVPPSSTTNATRMCYAIAVDSGSEDRNVLWTGKALEHFAKFPSFRAKFDLYVQCESVHQVLPRGARLLVDLHAIQELPGPGREFPVALLRLYPLPAAEAQRKTPIKDLGYEDSQESITGGFHRGWYHDDRYWRVVGDNSAQWISGGALGKPLERNVRVEYDLGYANTRVLVDIPGYGVAYCRGIGDDHHDPSMACVLFSECDIEQKSAFQGYIGRWSDIIQ